MSTRKRTRSSATLEHSVKLRRQVKHVGSEKTKCHIEEINAGVHGSAIVFRQSFTEKELKIIYATFIKISKETKDNKESSIASVTNFNKNDNGYQIAGYVNCNSIAYDVLEEYFEPIFNRAITSEHYSHCFGKNYQDTYTRYAFANYISLCYTGKGSICEHTDSWSTLNILLNLGKSAKFELRSGNSGKFKECVLEHGDAIIFDGNRLNHKVSVVSDSVGPKWVGKGFGFDRMCIQRRIRRKYYSKRTKILEHKKRKAKETKK